MTSDRETSRIAWPALAGTILLALLVGTVGWSDESYFELGGDQPKYLVNGVFFLDLVKDSPAAARNFPAYARNYYAQYPALTLGHHPFLPSLLAAPMYALLGISVQAARVVPLISFVLASVLLLLLVEQIYNRWVALAATLIFVLSPAAAWVSRILTSEMPALAALMATVFFCERYGRNGRRLDLWLLMVSAVTSVWAKQLTFIIVPVVALQMIRHRGIRVLWSRDVIVCALVGAVLLAPLVPIMLRFSAHDITWVTATATRHGDVDYIALLAGTMAAQLSWPVVCLVAVAVLRSGLNRDGRSLLFIAWLLAYALFVILLTKDVETARFTVYWTPALAALAATIVSGWSAPALRAAAWLVTILVVGNEGIVASRVRLGGAAGYEDGARYVVEHTHGPATVLFSGPIDTGYFAFFVRKHDPDRRLIVLRSDKMVHQAADVEPVLRAFGTRFIVVEDRPSSTPALDWLRTRMTQPPFEERLRVPFHSTDARLRGVDLVVFENVGVPAPNRDARLRLDVPLGGLLIDVRLGDLLNDSESRLRRTEAAPE